MYLRLTGFREESRIIVCECVVTENTTAYCDSLPRAGVLGPDGSTLLEHLIFFYLRSCFSLVEEEVVVRMTGVYSTTTDENPGYITPSLNNSNVKAK